MGWLDLPERFFPLLYVPRLVRGIQSMALIALQLDPANKSRDVEKKAMLKSSSLPILTDRY
jgi:hypothetical protein